ncbi:MAG: Sua5/YciO/YrdC/YwlC family protein, partial [Prevotellaceae bacterium]|nr:Sua5/YciO/YrdC/YwlC family protein [Prevotellaceae bacterium]
MRIMEEVERIADMLRKGGVMLYPTDTLWGLGCDATNREAVAK